MLDLLIDLLILAGILLACLGYGWPLLRWAPLPAMNRSQRLALTLGSGLGLIMLLLFGLALIGLLIPAAGWALLLIGLSLWALNLKEWQGFLQGGWQSLRSILRVSRFARGAVALMLIMGLLTLVADLAPTMEGDSVHQYLLLPRYWVEAGRYVQPAHIWAATLPGNAMMISAWALLLRPENFALPALISGLGMSLAFALAIYTLTRPHFGQGAALLASAVAYTMPDLFYLAASAKVDMAWALFEALTLAAFLQYLDSPENDTRWLLISGAMLGLAAGTKNQTPISMLLLSLWLVIVLIRKGATRQIPARLLSFWTLIALTGFPYYLYNLIVLGNPLYPVAADLFLRFGGLPSPRSELGTEVFYAWNLPGYLQNLWNTSLGHGPDFYLGFIAGPLFLLAIPAGALLGVFRGHRKVGSLLLYVLAFSVIWFLIKQAARHFLPGLSLLSMVAGLALWETEQQKQVGRWIVGAAAVICALWNLAIGGSTLLWSGAYRVALGLETREQYVLRWHDTVIISTFPDYESVAWMNQHLGPDDRILSEHATSPLYIRAQIVSGGWGDRLNYAGIEDEQSLLNALRAQDIGYIQVYQVDPPGPELYNQTDFLAAYGDLVYEGARTRLYRIIYP